MTKLDMTPGAQIPRTDSGPQTAVTQALSSAAYRDSDLDEFVAKVQDGVVGKAGWHELFRPNVGEAFSKAVIARTLGAGRKPLVPAFGTEPRMVVEHCLAAEELRRARDKRLMLVTLVTGALFLPGALLWLLSIRGRIWLRTGSANRDALFGPLVMLVPTLIAGALAWHPPLAGFWGLYARIVLLVPLVGWVLAKRMVIASVKDLRARWADVLDGNLNPVLPNAVPRHDDDKKATALKEGLDRLTVEQHTNVLHYAGVNGILGLGRRWGSWELVEDLRPVAGLEDFRTFHTWDLVRKITDRLNGLSRSEVGNGAVPGSSVEQWVIMEVGAGADEIGRPDGPDMDGQRMRDHAVVNLANRQGFGQDGPRHYLGTQFVLNKGRLVVSVLVTVTVLSNTLRVSVNGHTLGPINGIFHDKPKVKERTAAKTGKFWEERTIQLPLVDNLEVVRQALRAPFYRAPGLLNWLGGTMKLPEPFGLRTAWATAPWNSRFMSDDSIRIATPVVSAVLAATIEFLADHDVNTERFANRGLILKSEMQGVRPFKSDQYDAW
ncbi:hypothetical protein C7C46_22970 [Streptomyces tateyamensis]|uniref:Uncharacterized protein n=1 Tax=Streptomyces tateyamensis TaxID=565073 RepID=A0A2V4N4S0_9ACTN|nr:hypothetical protein [Streptomyces tateyamensis]PYC76338.1 hypothetical protein C7C46_22970 [Streptomyces tateyamensis]